jgi:hypothetical protein
MRLVRLLLCATLAVPLLSAQRAEGSDDGGEQSCFGDCNDNGTVAVNEVVVLMNIAIGKASPDDCRLRDSGITVPAIDDLLRAVNLLLNGCPPAETPTPSPTPTAPLGLVRLTRDDILRIEFLTTPPFIESLPNVLYAFLGHVSRREPFNSITGSLYDGARLLGVSTSSNGCCGTGIYSFNPVPVTWKSPGSPWDFPAGDPAVVDFTSMHDGSIEGRIDIVIDAGSFDLDLRNVALRFIHATSSNGGSSIPPAPVLRSVRIIPRVPVSPSPTAVSSPTVTVSPTAVATPIASPTIDIDDDD